MHEAVVCIGSNVADAHNRVSMALEWLSGLMQGTLHSEPYETAPEGDCAGHTPYVNAVLKGSTTLSAETLTAMFKDYEYGQGRRPLHKATSHIIIDIDLVCFDGNVVNPAEFSSGYFNEGYRRLM